MVRISAAGTALRRTSASVRLSPRPTPRSTQGAAGSPRCGSRLVGGMASSSRSSASSGSAVSCRAGVPTTRCGCRCSPASSRSSRWLSPASRRSSSRSSPGRCTEAGSRPSPTTRGSWRRDGRRLKQGLVLTFAALAVLGLGTASGWWPQDEGAGGAGELVAVEATNGQRWCGRLEDAGPGRVSISVDGSPVVVSLKDVVAVGPADGC